MFIELTQKVRNGNLMKIMVNVDSIQVYWQNGNETSVFVNGWDTAFNVIESYEEIRELIE